MKAIHLGHVLLVAMILSGSLLADRTSAQSGVQAPSQTTAAQPAKDVNALLERMNTLINRLHTMHQMVEKQLQTEVLPENAAQLRHLQDLDGAMGEVGDHLKTTLERFNTLREDPAVLKDAALSQDASILREQLMTFAQEMQKAVGTLEQMHKRVLAKKNK